MSELNEIKSGQIDLFFPYYVNQGRLLDIYAILNGGYSEYTEITSAVSSEKSKTNKGQATANVGFKLFNFGGEVSFEREGGKKDASQRENHEKKVQTVTSILSIVKATLSEKKLIVDLIESKPGQFVLLPVCLSINSIRSVISEMSDLMKLATDMQKLGANIKGAGKNTNNYDSTLKSLQVLFEGEEILYQTDDYAIIGTISDANLYQSSRADIIGAEMMCLAQVKRVYPEGTDLTKNTLFSRIKDEQSKQSFIQAIENVSDSNAFDFEAVAVSSIKGKPVYQLEIISLYQ